MRFLNRVVKACNMTYKELLSSLLGCMDWFDVAARCYLYLIQEALPSAHMYESTFISEYFEAGNEAGVTNPNLTQLDALLANMREAIEATIMKGRRCKFSDGLNKVIDLLKSVSLKKYGNSVTNEASPLWFLILAIDSAYEKNDKRKQHVGYRPLNQNAVRDKIGVYFSSYKSMLDDNLMSHGVVRLPQVDFQNELSCLVFYKKIDSSPLPSIRTLVSSSLNFGPSTIIENSGSLKGLMNIGEEGHCVEPNVRIGVCPFASHKIDDFDSNCPIEYVKTSGGAFIAKYNLGIEKYFDEVITTAIDEAIKNGCHILVFPELVFAPSFHLKVRDLLKERENRGSLMLLIAGSTWEDSKRQNVSYIYDGKGRLLGRQHKHESYSFETESGTMCENLYIPSDPDTFVDLPGLGRVIVAICKDVVIDTSRLYTLVNTFMPQILCIPTLSASLRRGFRSQVKDLAERKLVISCMANLCAKRQGSEIGYICAPGYKIGEESTYHAETVLRSFERKAGCEKCQSAPAIDFCSCLDIVDINYSNEDGGVYPKIEICKININ